MTDQDPMTGRGSEPPGPPPAGPAGEPAAPPPSVPDQIVTEPVAVPAVSETPIVPPPVAPPPVAEPTAWAQPAAAPVVPPPPAASQWTQPEAPSPQGPAPGYAYAGFWRRFAAYLIDGVLFWIVAGIIFSLFVAGFDRNSWTVLTQLDPVTGRPLASDSEIVAAVGRFLGLVLAAIAVNWLIDLLYHVILWSWLGGTIGQLALGMQVRRESDGTKIGLGTSLLRYIGYVISIWVFYLGLIWVAFDSRKQGWHDKIASTLVVRRAD